MPGLAEHQSSKFTKCLFIGDSKSGKTGALASLAIEGYKLRILDYDNGLDILAKTLRDKKPEALKNVEYRTLRDKLVSTPVGTIVEGTPKAFSEGLKLLDNWKYGDTDLGKPATWGPDCILVIDSLTFMADAAFRFREPLTPKSRDGKYDKRAVYGDAQDAIADVLDQVTSDTFQSNVIVTSHIRYVDNPDGTKKGYPTAVGSALSPEIPRFFNTVALCQTQAGGKRTIVTAATAMIDLANPANFSASLPIETGMAAFFKSLRS